MRVLFLVGWAYLAVSGGVSGTASRLKSDLPCTVESDTLEPPFVVWSCGVHEESPAEHAMPRMARVVCPGFPHHSTQRGVRRFNVFLDDVDHNYPWSSATTHCGLADDPILSTAWPDVSAISNWSSWLAATPDVALEHRIRARTYTGRPCGSEEFVRQIEALTGRRLAPGKPRPKPKRQLESQPLLWTEDSIQR